MDQRTVILWENRAVSAYGGTFSEKEYLEYSGCLTPEKAKRLLEFIGNEARCFLGRRYVSGKQEVIQYVHVDRYEVQSKILTVLQEIGHA